MRLFFSQSLNAEPVHTAHTTNENAILCPKPKERMQIANRQHIELLCSLWMRSMLVCFCFFLFSSFSLSLSYFLFGIHLQQPFSRFIHFIWTSCKHCFTQTSYALNLSKKKIKKNTMQQQKQKNEWKGSDLQKTTTTQDAMLFSSTHIQRILFANLSNLQEFAFSCFYFDGHGFPFFSVLLNILCLPVFTSSNCGRCFCLWIANLMIAPKMVNLNYLSRMLNI